MRKPFADRPRPPAGGTPVWVVLAASFVAMSLYHASMRGALTVPFERARVEALVEGTAYTPFQYRVLIPLALRVATAAGGRGTNALPELAFASDTPLHLLFLGALFFWLRRISFPPLPALLLTLLGAPLLLFELVLPRVTPFYNLPDTPAVFFMTAGLAALALRRWPLFYALFALGTLNRETTCFLTVAMLLTLWDREPRVTLVRHFAAQAALWLAIKAVLFAVYRNNPEPGLFELFHVAPDGTILDRSHLEINLKYLARAQNLPLVGAVLGGLWLPVLVFAHRIRDPFLRRAPLTFVAYIAAMLAIGNVFDVRIFGEFTGLFAVAGAALLRDTLTAPGAGEAAA